MGNRACMKLLLILLWLLPGLITHAADGGHGEVAIAAPEPHASRAGLAVLERGGNAVDAAVTVAFVLAVTLPDAGNIGGGGFMTLYFDGQPGFLDYRETAPAAAERDMYLDAQGQVRVDDSLTGHRAAGVPGTVAGLWAAHQRFGSLTWASLLEPAIELAEQGFMAPAWLVELVQGEAERLGDSTNFYEYFGELRTDEVFQQPALAASLRRIAAAGADGFYRGETARLISAEMRAGGGLISESDLAGYRPVWREPLAGVWRDYRIITAPLPSSGGFAIVQYLAMKDFMAADFAGQSPNSPQFIHLKSEIEKRIFADRARYLGDPDYVSVPFERLLDSERLRLRAAEIRPDVISATEAITPLGEPLHTTHFSILDAQGNAVSNTYTLNTDFGSGVVVSGAGFLLNNEMDDFSVAPGQPNYYGVVGDEANAIAPGKRMLSSMSPTILLRDKAGDKAGVEEVAMVVGAMGGSTIFTTVYQTISNIVEYGMTPAEAQAATRVHHQLLPQNLITYSPTTPLPGDTVRALSDRGYRVEPHDWEFGNVQLIWRRADGRLEAVSDPRFPGESFVVPFDPPPDS